jgi:hypothetical protein
MEDQRMTELFRALPTERASEDFNERLLARLDTAAPARRGGSGWVWAAGGAALLLLVPLSGKLLAPARRVEPGEARLLLNQIQSEHRQLERELQALRQLQSEQPEQLEPVLYLGGDDDVDYVVDLERVRQIRNARSDRYNL